MSGLKTFLWACLAMIALPAATFAAPPDLSQKFATCAGRLSAQMEFQWLLGGDADATQGERDAMLSLLSAVMAEDGATETLARRIEAKHAQTALLTRGHFNDDEDDAAWARLRAEVEIGGCRALLLG